MAAEQRFDLIVLGGGPGGYVAAIKAAQEGLRVALVEADRLGGVCVNWGCIPSKALLSSARLYELMLRAREFGLSAGEPGFDWPAVVKRSRQSADRTFRGVQYLMKKNGITVVAGRGKLEPGRKVRVFDRAGEETALLTAEHIILATGARPRTVPGLTPDGRTVITSREALALERLPQSAVIVGGGAIGLEFAYLFQTFGVRVTLVELLPRILPLEDEEISAELRRLFEKKGMRILTGAMVRSAQPVREGGLEVVVATGERTETIACELALVAVGVTGNVEELGLEESGVEVKGGFIRVDRRFRTAADGVRAIGDCIGAPLLAHAASREGVNAVELILGREPRLVPPELVPSCIYCQPQVAGIGLSEARAREQGFDISVGRFPFRPLGKAIAAGEQEGFVKTVIDKASGRLLGVHILGAEATELIPEASLALWLEAGAEALHGALHPHPTLSEAMVEAAAAATGRAIHL